MRIPFTSVDELGRVFERRAEPNTVHFEVQVPGPIDAERLRHAVRDVLAVHPLLRARRRAAGPTRRSWWEIAEQADLDPVEVGTGTIDAERERLFAERIALEHSPLIRVRLVKTPERDAVMLGAHHALFDGVSCLRLMRSIAAAYSGEPDQVPPIDPLTIRTATLPPHQSPNQDPHTAVPTRRSARIARDTHTPGPGYGFALRILDTEPTAALNAARQYGASVNDMLLAALFETVATWNRRHATGYGRVTITMPLNARPAQYREEFLGNLSRIVSIGVADTERDDTRQLLGSIVRQTAEAKRCASPHAAGLVGAVLGAGRLPYPLRRALLAAGQLAAGGVTDTTCLSNIGRISDVFSFGSAADRLWASPPAPMPRGLSVGAATYRGRLHLTVRHRHALLDASAAEEFATVLVTHVHDLAAEIATLAGATGALS
ncbi:NRPS condensation-like uncharacterized protein [Catenulispora sp. GAS73]|uniref:condensation domain-containing protein n=1 Tax=Catenulispora sp. GAS73 TaxID=3156269 RepID=UPI0035184B6F